MNLIQDGNEDILQKIFELNDLVISDDLTICHVSDVFSGLLCHDAEMVEQTKLSHYIDATDSEYLLSILSKEDNRSANIQLSFQQGIEPNSLFSLSFDHVVLSGHHWMILRKYNREIDVLNNIDYFFEYGLLATLIVEPETLQVIAGNQKARTLFPHLNIKDNDIVLSQMINLPYAPLAALFEDVSLDEGSLISVPIYVDNHQTNQVSLQINKIEYKGRVAWLTQILHEESVNDTDEVFDTNKELTDALFETKEYGVLILDSFGVITQINQTMCDLLKAERGKVIGYRARNVLPNHISKLISTSESSQHKISLAHSSQSFNLQQFPLRNTQGYVLGLSLEIRSNNGERQGLISRAYEAANNAGNHAVFITDKRGFIMYVNTMFEHQTGYRKESIIGQNFSILKSEDSNEDIIQNLWRTINNKDTWRGILKNQRQSGASYWSDLTVKPLTDREGNIECFVGLSDDITLQKEMQKSGTYLANYDVTTGLANSILAKDRLEGMMGRARRRKLIVAVIYLDILQINDIAKQYDEEISNSILLIYCNNLQHALRAEDAVARMSNDRLAILLPDLPNVEALDVVSAKIDRVNQQTITVGEHSFRFDIRQGVSYYPEQGLDCESLLKNAEASIIKAWSTGEPIGCFSKGQHDNALMHFQMRREIESMIENKKFDVKYQPIINLEDDSIYSVEAQIIWHHKTYGSIGNDEVYAVAEASGCAHELGLLVLEQVCIDANYWQKIGINDVNISVNLSHGQLRDKTVPDQFSEMLQRYKISNQRLSLEIPLSYIATQWLDLDEVLQQFSLLGFSLQYDKFGDRGAYISDLRNFPFTGIKLTQEYIAHIDEDVSTANLVEGIVSMASSLNLDVTAVGVTEFSQILQLQEMGCKRAQGAFLCTFTDRDGIGKFIQQGTTI